MATFRAYANTILQALEGFFNRILLTIIAGIKIYGTNIGGQGCLFQK